MKHSSSARTEVRNVLEASVHGVPRLPANSDNHVRDTIMCEVQIYPADTNEKQTTGLHFCIFRPCQR